MTAYWRNVIEALVGFGVFLVIMLAWQMIAAVASHYLWRPLRRWWRDKR